MASLIVATGLIIHDRVHARKEAKREKQRLAYDARYRELEHAHVTHQEKVRTQTSRSGDSQQHNEAELVSSDVTGVQETKRQSSDSREMEWDSGDDPARWVDEVVRQQSKK